ncbi:Cullin [Cladochytrium replicatum]|nr:Cullin [Cladochytrium replicatum]
MSHPPKRPALGTKLSGGAAASKTIRPARRSANEQLVADAWETLRSAIGEIYRKNQGTLSFEVLYRNAYNLVSHRKAEDLYRGVREEIRDHLRRIAQSKIVPVFPRETTGGDAAGVAGSSSSSSSSSTSAVSRGRLIGAPEYLRALKIVWEDFTAGTVMVRDILMYLDKGYVKLQNVTPVYELGLELFRDVVLRSVEYPIGHHMLESILYLIELEREGDVIDRLVLKGVVDMLVSLDAGGQYRTSSVYESDFETFFLQTSRSFYELESQSFLRQCDASEYLKKVEKRLAEEEMRTKHYLTSTTEPKIRRILEEEAIERHLETIIELGGSGLVPMLTHDKIDDLQRMYRMFGRVPNGHREMRKAICDHVKLLGQGINETFGGAPPAPVPTTTSATTATSSSSAPPAAPEPQGVNAIRWVECMLELKDTYDRILDVAFKKDKTFQNDISDAIEVCVNANARSPEFMSLFIDENLRKGLKGKSESEMDGLLDKTVTLFRFIKEKDVFERYYKQHLAKRLLFGKSVSEDAEKGMISRLKVECGTQFTHKLEGMFNDLRISTDTMAEFRRHLTNTYMDDDTRTVAPELTVNVLTATYWPMSAPTTNLTCAIPSEVARASSQFERFYLARHSGRRLTWLNNMGFADIKATFEKGKKELNVSTFAMVVLVGVFNKEDPSTGAWVSYEEIKNITAMNEPELKRTLQALSLAKYKILLKREKTREVGPDDAFALNVNFTSQLNKIKVPVITGAGGGGTSGGQFAATGANVAENDGERSETMEKVDEGRKHQIEAAIVRIMKSRKRLDHASLVSEVVRQLSSRFQANPVMIKKRIEGLIEREYLERDKSDRKMYIYLA